MSFRIDPAKPFEKEFVAVGCELIDDAIDILREQPDGQHKAVHEARKKFKRLRALYRLVQKDVPDFRSTENARFRDIARSLAGARDAAALVETIDHLASHAVSDAELNALTTAHEILSTRRDRLVADEGDLDASIEIAITQCGEARNALQNLSLADGKKSAGKRIEAVWKKQRRIALKALQHCHAEATSEHFHELRKSGQIYWMHLALLRRLWPSAMRAKQRQAKQLVDLLGHEHDLSVLAAFVDRQPQAFPDADVLARLLGAIITRQQALKAESLDLAAQVFSDSARDESRMIRMLWDRQQT